MGTVALYLRLSNEDEKAGESVSIANQRDLLYRFVRERREFDGRPVLEFCDDGYSGVNFSRPGIQKLLSLAGKTVDCIIVKDFSRFGRNLVEVGDYLDQIFPFLGVRFIAVNEGYDSGQGYGSTVSLDVSLKAFVYEMYSRDISEKVRSVKHAKMRKGEYLCGIAFYGYKRSETKKNSLEVDSAAAEVVRRIFRMASDGMAPVRIAAELNRDGIPSPLMYRKANHTEGMRGWAAAGEICYWTRDNVRGIIRDERYTGCLVGGKRAVADLADRRTKPVPRDEWIVTENTHEALVGKETFAQAQAVLKKAGRKKKVQKPYQKFRGLLKCAYCGRALGRIKCKKTYFFCPTAKIVEGCACTAVYMEEEVLEDALLAAIQLQVRFFQDAGLRVREDTKERLLEEMKACQAAASRYKVLQAASFEDYAEGRIGKRAYLSRKQEIVMRQEETERRYEELADQFAQVHGGKERKGIGFGKYAFVKELSRELLVELVKEIRVSGKGVMETVWNFEEPGQWN